MPDEDSQTRKEDAFVSSVLALPWRMLQAATAKVPATRYALAIAGVAAALALAVEFLGSRDPAAIKATLTGVAAMLLLMTVMVVFAAVARVAPTALKLPATFLVWAALVFVVGAAFLTASCLFFRWPMSFPALSSELFGVAVESVTAPPDVTYDATGHAVKPGRLCLKEVEGQVDGAEPFEIRLGGSLCSDEPLRHVGQCVCVVPGNVSMGANYPNFRCDSSGGRREDGNLQVTVEPGGQAEVSCRSISEAELRREMEARPWTHDDVSVQMTYSPGDSGPVPLQISLHAKAFLLRPGTAQFHWDFGDGSTSSEESATHVYTKPGMYNVRLTVSAGGIDVSDELDIQAMTQEEWDAQAEN
jgi:hypothetical protein